MSRNDEERCCVTSQKTAAKETKNTVDTHNAAFVFETITNIHWKPDTTNPFETKTPLQRTITPMVVAYYMINVLYSFEWGSELEYKSCYLLDSGLSNE